LLSGDYSERISPGPFATEDEYTHSAESGTERSVYFEYSVGRGRVEEIGALAAFLCSDDAGYYGHRILIDGGWCAM